MVSAQARIVAIVLRTFYKTGVMGKWFGDNVVRDRGGGIEAAARRPARGSVITPVTAADVACAWIEPLKSPTGPTIFYLHGGGYTTGSLTHYTDMLGLFARDYGMRALYVDYRIAPAHVFPAAVSDAVAAYRWLLQSGVDPLSVVFAGDSAGGGLAIATLLALREAGLALPAAVAVLSPWTDLEGTGDSLTTRKRADPMLNSPGVKPSGRAYLGSADARDPLASPLYGDLRGLPPLMIQVGDAEILLDDSTRIAERARDAGVSVTAHIWPGLFHVFPIFPALMPEARAADREVAEFFLANTRTHSSTQARSGATRPV